MGLATRSRLCLSLFSFEFSFILSFSFSRPKKERTAKAELTYHRGCRFWDWSFLAFLSEASADTLSLGQSLHLCRRARRTSFWRRPAGSHPCKLSCEHTRRSNSFFFRWWWSIPSERERKQKKLSFTACLDKWVRLAPWALRGLTPCHWR